MAIGSTMDLFSIVTLFTSILGGIGLTLYLYVSDGPVLFRDKTLVRSDESDED